MSDELLQKVITRATVAEADGGLLSPQQADRFIDYMWDATVLGAQVRRVRMRADTVELEKIRVGERILRGATEAVDTGVNAGVAFSKISLTTKKLRLDWEISTEVLEDNIEGEDLEDHIARLMATQAGNDLEDLAINGDTTSTDPLIKQFDGWRRLAINGTAEGAAHVLDHAGQPLNRAAFNKALKIMPRKFMQNRAGLRFFVGTNLIQDLLYSETQTSTTEVRSEAVALEVINNGVRTEGGPGYLTGRAFGVGVQEIPYFLTDRAGTYSGATGDHGDLWLTYPKNLLWGVKREIKIYRKFAEKKDTTEYTMYTRVGTGIENTDAFVVVRNIKAQA